MFVADPDRPWPWRLLTSCSSELLLHCVVKAHRLAFMVDEAGLGRKRAVEAITRYPMVMLGLQR